MPESLLELIETTGIQSEHQNPKREHRSYVHAHVCTYNTRMLERGNHVMYIQSPSVCPFSLTQRVNCKVSDVHLVRLRLFLSYGVRSTYSIQSLHIRTFEQMIIVWALTKKQLGIINYTLSMNQALRWLKTAGRLQLLRLTVSQDEADC